MEYAAFKHLNIPTIDKVMDLAYYLQQARCANPQSQGLGGPFDGDDLRDPPEKTELVKFVDRLPLDVQSEILALMWIGKNDGEETAEDYSRLVDDASVIQNVGLYMTMPGLLKYLENGLRVLEPMSA